MHPTRNEAATVGPGFGAIIEIEEGGAMSKVIEGKRGGEPDHPTTVEDHELPPLAVERPTEFTPAPAFAKSSRLIRWMGWLLGAVILIGGGGLVWWIMSQGEEVIAPTAVDPHVSPEVLRTWAPGAAPGEIDPHVSPEVLRTWTPGVAPGEIDPHVSPEILRSRTP